MLGFDVSERTICRWMKRVPRDHEPAKRWVAFLRNHQEAVAAMDFFKGFWRERRSMATSEIAVNASPAYPKEGDCFLRLSGIDFGAIDGRIHANHKKGVFGSRWSGGNRGSVE
jgi:hypothetical protein